MKIITYQSNQPTLYNLLREIMLRYLKDTKLILLPWQLGYSHAADLK